MPNIEQEHRQVFDGKIHELAMLIRMQAKDDLDVAGFLNYCCTCLGLRVIPARRYHWMAFIYGTWGTMMAEFYHKYVRPYEDEAERKNGPVY